MLELNKIHLGDCYKLIKEIPDKSIDLIVTDPPYEIKNTKAGGKSDFAKSIQNMNDELEANQITESIDISILDDFRRVMKKINCYIWCNKSQIKMYLNYFDDCAFDIILWRKTNAMPTFCNKYLSDKEYCLYFRKNGYCYPTTYEKAKTIYDQPINLVDKNNFEHPTIKPLNIIKTLIENSSKPNDIVFDPFVGSGTTCVGAKDLNRQYLGIEISPKWHKVACDRLDCFTAGGQQSLFLI
jgi:DNA modification methylase